MSDTPAPEELAAYVRDAVREGFRDADEVTEQVSEYYEIEPDTVASVVAAAYEAFLAEVKTWPAVTDNDRLDGAFGDLDAAGIVARQNFTCCNTCGHSEIGDEIEAARTDDRPVGGYVFYHQQDTESAVGGGGIALRFGAVTEGHEAAVAVANRICHAVKARGLTTEWNGDPSKVIWVTSFNWQRRPAA